MLVSYKSYSTIDKGKNDKLVEKRAMEEKKETNREFLSQNMRQVVYRRRPSLNPAPLHHFSGRLRHQQCCPYNQFTDLQTQTDAQNYA